MTGAPDLGGLPGWYREIFPDGPRDGFFHKLGAHSVLHVARDPEQLVVSFDNLAEAGNPRHDREAWAAKFIADNGWSHLGILAQGPTWFRDARLIDFLETLAAQGFFARFDRVAFCGTSMGGFGAVAFCGLAPGATVIAFSPQSTLGADRVPWETRFAKGRRQDWSQPYSDAAEHCGTAGRLYLAYDPYCRPDRAHADRLAGANVVPLRAIGLGHKSALLLRRMDRLKPVMKGAIENTLTAAEFSRLIANRKDVYLYRRVMEDHLADRNRPALAARFAQAFKARRRRTKTAGEGGAP